MLIFLQLIVVELLGFWLRLIFFSTNLFLLDLDGLDVGNFPSPCAAGLEESLFKE